MPKPTLQHENKIWFNFSIFIRNQVINYFLNFILFKLEQN